MKKRVFCILLSLCTVLLLSCPALAVAGDAQPIAYEVNTTNTDNVRSVDKDVTNVTIKGGASKKIAFDMSNGAFGTGTPHNAFNVRVTNVSVNSKYTLSITYDGIELWNKQYTGDAAVNVTNCSKGQDWIVFIVKDSSKDMSCYYSIKSFIKL